MHPLSTTAVTTQEGIMTCYKGSGTFRKYHSPLTSQMALSVARILAWLISRQIFAFLAWASFHILVFLSPFWWCYPLSHPNWNPTTKGGWKKNKHWGRDRNGAESPEGKQPTEVSLPVQLTPSGAERCPPANKISFSASLSSKILADGF